MKSRAWLVKFILCSWMPLAAVSMQSFMDTDLSIKDTAATYEDASAANFTIDLSGEAIDAEADEIPIDGYAKLTVIRVDDTQWTVYEDLKRVNGPIVYVSSTGKQKIFRKTSEATYWKENAKYPRNLGMRMEDIGMGLRDLLADELLKDGEPIEEKVAAIIPPLGSLSPGAPGTPATWTTFVGNVNVHANDNVPIFGYGSTRSFYPGQKFPIRASKQRLEGRVGGWMPAVRKVHPEAEKEFTELIIFGDVDAPDPFIVQTWHRTARIKDGVITRVLYSKSYPEFGPFHKNPSPEEFYTALFRFGAYWEKHLSDFSSLTLPDQSWADMTKYALAKELMVRPGGVYPKYGAIERDYYGSEYDGFQDIFTSSVAANLDWGRFKQAKAVIENYFTLFVSPTGSINMRGPEVAQFGMTLSLLARYVQYTGDNSVIEQYKEKILATVNGLIKMHDDSLKLSKTDPGHGLIHGWSESDACLKGDPDVYWKPYFANNAFTARGLKDIATLTVFNKESVDWNKRAADMTDRLIKSMRASVLNDKRPAYMPPLPGTNKTFRESMATDKPSSQDWPHRLYTELLHAAVLPNDLANHVHDTMRAYGATSLGVVANVGVPNRYTRDLLGFISYGYAYSLLLLDRSDEFVLFMYSHRYHVHSRGAWKAGEVTGITGNLGTFCIPAQLTIPSIVRWALILEHPDESILYFGRGLPRSWLATGKMISIKKAPTRWGLIDFDIKFYTESDSLRANVKFERDVPKTVEVKLRTPKGSKIISVTTNGRDANMKGEAVIVDMTPGLKEVTIEAKLS